MRYVVLLLLNFLHEGSNDSFLISTLLRLCPTKLRSQLLNFFVLQSQVAFLLVNKELQIFELFFVLSLQLCYSLVNIDA